MEIVYGIRNGVKGRFNDLSWPIAERAGWKLVTEENDTHEPPVDVITFLRDQPLVDIHVKAIDFTEPEPEPVEDIEPDTQDSGYVERPEKAAKKTAKPRGRAKSKK